jgi:hypothetical protein
MSLAAAVAKMHAMPACAPDVAATRLSLFMPRGGQRAFLLAMGECLAGQHHRAWASHMKIEPFIPKQLARIILDAAGMRNIAGLYRLKHFPMWTDEEPWQHLSPVRGRVDSAGMRALADAGGVAALHALVLAGPYGYAFPTPASLHHAEETIRRETAKALHRAARTCNFTALCAFVYRQYAANFPLT